MNWYKKSQKIPTMENITWAIDKLIAENYEFTVEELSQASQGYGEQQSAIPKAAQTATERKYRSGVAPKLENIGPNEYGNNILNKYEEMRQEMKGNFNIRSISRKQIAAELNIDTKYVKTTLIANGINLLDLITERKNLMAKNICDIVNNASIEVQQLRPGKLKSYVVSEFEKMYNFKLSPTGVNSALALNNLGEYNKNDPDAIFKSFTNYMNGMIQGGRSIFFAKPEKLPMYIDKFFQRYGEQNGFLPLEERRSLKLYLTKKQMEENTKNMEVNKYTPVDYSDNNPATFLYDRE